MKMRRLPGMLACLGLCACLGQAAVENASGRIKRLDTFFNEAVANEKIPSAQVYISYRGEPIYHEAFGYQDLDSEDALETSSIFRMASMTKGLTAVAILQLVEQGKIFLDDELWHYIPEFKHPQVLVELHENSTYTSRPAASEITIRQLLTHTSGIGYGFQNDSYNKLVLMNDVSEGFEDDQRTAIYNARQIARLPLLHDPGEAYTYGLSYDVLGVLIEIVSGLRYDAYIEKHMLEPLDMEDSYFLIPESQRNRLVRAYEYKQDGKGFRITSYPDKSYPVADGKAFFSGGADLCSTAEDYAKFIQMIMNGGLYNNRRILGERFIEMMLSPQTKFNDGRFEQGFAAWVTREAGAAEAPMDEGSYGFGGFWDTYGWADPKGEFVAVLLLQMYPTNRYKIHERFQAITYGVIDELKEKVEQKN